MRNALIFELLIQCVIRSSLTVITPYLRLDFGVRPMRAILNFHISAILFIFIISLDLLEIEEQLQLLLLDHYCCVMRSSYSNHCCSLLLTLPIAIQNFLSYLLSKMNVERYF